MKLRSYVIFLARYYRLLCIHMPHSVIARKVQYTVCVSSGCSAVRPHTAPRTGSGFTSNHQLRGKKSSQKNKIKTHLNWSTAQSTPRAPPSPSCKRITLRLQLHAVTTSERYEDEDGEHWRMLPSTSFHSYKRPLCGNAPNAF